MKSDAEIQKDVNDQLRWEPSLNAADIGVTVRNGVVTLGGNVDSYYKKMTAERVVKNVAGVRAIAEDMQIGVFPGLKKTDAEIASAVLDALRWHSAVPEEKIKVKVENGNVTLEGEMEWSYQKTAAQNAVANFTGIRNIINNLTIRPKVTPDDLKQKINAVFQRSATLDARNINVEVTGNKAVLKGKVRSYAEKEDACDAVMAAPGIAAVKNDLEVEYEPISEVSL